MKRRVLGKLSGHSYKKRLQNLYNLVLSKMFGNKRKRRHGDRFLEQSTQQAILDCTYTWKGNRPLFKRHVEEMISCREIGCELPLSVSFNTVILAPCANLMKIKILDSLSKTCFMTHAPADRKQICLISLLVILETHFESIYTKTQNHKGIRRRS